MYSKSEIIKRNILGNIRSGKLAPGDRIPSRHELMNNFNCSRCCVDRAVTELIAGSHLTSRRGSGTFVSKSSDRNSKCEFQRLYSICNSLTSNNLPLTLTRLREKFECHTVFRHDTAGRLKELARPGNAIIWDSPGYSSLMHIDYLAALGIRQLLIGRIFRDYEYVTTDSAAGINEGLKWLKSKGVRTIGFIGRQPQTGYPYLAGRELDFYACAIENSLHIAPEHHFIDNFSENPEDKINTIAKQIAAGIFPQGFYIESISLVPMFLDACKDLNKLCGRDFYMLTFDHSDKLLGIRGLCMLKQNYRQMGKFVEQWALSGSREPMHKNIPPLMIAG